MATLSCVIGTYNDAAMLREAVSRLAAQTRPFDEIIIVDDGSTDGPDHIYDLASVHKNVRTVALTTNVGAVESYKRGYAIARGDYIYFAATDDGVQPQFVETMMGLAELFPAAGICSSDTELRSGTIRSPIRHGLSQDLCFMPPAAVATALHGQHIYSAGTIYRRSALPSSLMFDMGMRWHCDWFGNLVTAFRHGLAFAPEVHSFVTQRAESFSNQGRSDRGAQIDVIERAFELVNSAEFADVLPAFIWSRAMNHFGTAAATAMLRRPHLMTGINRLLIRDVLSNVQIA